MKLKAGTIYYNKLSLFSVHLCNYRRTSSAHTKMRLPAATGEKMVRPLLCCRTICYHILQSAYIQAVKWLFDVMANWLQPKLKWNTRDIA
jgi:hypothetical protein